MGSKSVNDNNSPPGKTRNKGHVPLQPKQPKQPAQLPPPLSRGAPIQPVHPVQQRNSTQEAQTLPQILQAQQVQTTQQGQNAQQGTSQQVQLPQDVETPLQSPITQQVNTPQQAQQQGSRRLPRYAPSTHGPIILRQFNGVHDDKAFVHYSKQDGLTNLPPYTGRSPLTGEPLISIQATAYFYDLNRATTEHRGYYFPTSHHVESIGKHNVLVLGGYDFVDYGRAGQKSPAPGVSDGYQKESEIEWLDHGACAGPGDSLYWGPDDERTESTDAATTKLGGGMEHASEVMEDTWKTFMEDINFSGSEYLYRHGSKGAKAPPGGNLGKE
jgi:hypothetical protein